MDAATLVISRCLYSSLWQQAISKWTSLNSTRVLHSILYFMYRYNCKYNNIFNWSLEGIKNFKKKLIFLKKEENNKLMIYVNKIVLLILLLFSVYKNINMHNKVEIYTKCVCLDILKHISVLFSSKA